MPDQPDNTWSADGPQDAPETPEVATRGDRPETGGERGTRAARRAERDQSSRDDNVRTERDEARARADRAEAALNTMRDSHIRDRVAERLANPDDLSLVTTAEERAQFWNEDGSLDEGALAAALDRTLTERPHWAKPKARGGMDMGRRSTPDLARSVTMHDLLTGNVE